MKIVLFRDGKTGVAAKLPGENVDVELSDLLGGETRLKAVSGRLAVVVLKDGKEMGLEHRYDIQRLGNTPTPVYGDCALVALNVDGTYRDVSLAEVAAAGGYVRCV